MIRHISVILLLIVLPIITARATNSNEQIFKMVIVHTNDMHARFAETSKMSSTCTKSQSEAKQCYGGFARVAHVIREARRKYADTDEAVLVLNAGDTYTGSPYFTEFNWTISTEFVNLLDFDALSLGNHEFDLGVRGLRPFVDGVFSPIVCANCESTNEPSILNSKLNKSVIIEKRGRRIGIVGYLTNETAELSNIDQMRFTDEIEAINSESERLRADGVDIIIALGHSGLAYDKRIAAECPLVDVVVGGHTHTFLYSGAEPDSEKAEGPYPVVVDQHSGKRVPIVQAYAYTKYVGELHVEFDEDGDLIDFHGSPILLNASVPQEEDVLEALGKYTPTIDALEQRIVGQTHVLLNQSKCRVMECNIGNLITDAIVKHYAQSYTGPYWTDAPIAIIHSGGIRATIGEPGKISNVTYADIIGTFPYDNVYATTIVSGNEILQILKHSISKIDVHSGGFLQVSGLHVIYDIANGPENPNITVRVRCGQCNTPDYEDLDLTKNYKILINNYLAGGGDGYRLFKEKEWKNENVMFREVLVWYITKHSPIIIGIDERIKIINREQSDDENSGANRLNSFNFIFLSVLVAIQFVKLLF